MTQIEREELVERYLSGEMNPSEEADFFLHAAVDDELQRTLKAFRIMEHAIQHDREMMVAERSRYREHVMGLLAVTTPIAGAGAGAAGASAGASGAGASAAGGGGFLGAGLGLWKTIVISVVAGSTMVGTALVVTSGRNDSHDRQVPAAVSAPSGESRGIDLTPPSDSRTSEPLPLNDPQEAATGTASEPAASSSAGTTRVEQKGGGTAEPRETRTGHRAGTAREISRTTAEEPQAKPTRKEPIRLDPQNNTKDLEVKIERNKGN